MAISMGFMLGREGPSIQLGAMSAKGLAKFLKIESFGKASANCQRSSSRAISSF